MKLQTSTKIWRKLETTICFLAWFLRNSVELRISGTEMLKKERNQKRRNLNALESENSWTTNVYLQTSASIQQRTNPPKPRQPASLPLLPGLKKWGYSDQFHQVLKHIFKKHDRNLLPVNFGQWLLDSEDKCCIWHASIEFCEAALEEAYWMSPRNKQLRSGPASFISHRKYVDAGKCILCNWSY